MMRAMIFVVPFIQLIILVNAATFELKNINLFVVDNDLSTTSRRLISKFDGSPFFTIAGLGFSEKEAMRSLNDNKVDMIISIPNNFEKNLIRENSGKLQMLINGINGAAAGLSNAYASSVIMDFNKDILSEYFSMSSAGKLKQINMTYTHWYNPLLNYKSFMVPGILALLVTMIGLYLSSMNTVKEKEMGTIEQINVTPIKKYQFIAGKFLPLWIIGLFEIALGLTIGKLLYDIPMIGNLGLVFLFISIYLPAALGVGLFVSTVTNTQQQAMLFSLFFTFIFILMSGLFTPVESMPKWAQYINIINPVAYIIRALRMILLKGSGFGDLINEFSALIIYSTTILSLAIWRYKKVS
jgi:ABC-2 type transport system permease protein